MLGGAVVIAHADSQIAQDLPFVADVHLVRVRPAQVGIDSGDDTAERPGEVRRSEILTQLRNTVAVRVDPFIRLTARAVRIERFRQTRAFAQRESVVARMHDGLAVAFRIPRNPDTRHERVPIDCVRRARECAIREQTGERRRRRTGLRRKPRHEILIADAERDRKPAIEGPSVLQEKCPFPKRTARIHRRVVDLHLQRNVVVEEHVDIAVDVRDIAFAAEIELVAGFEIVRAAQESALEIGHVGRCTGRARDIEAGVLRRSSQCRKGPIGD